MKIIQVIDQLCLGGAEKVCVDITNLLHKNNYDVKIILFDNYGEFLPRIDKGVEVVVLDKKNNKSKAKKILVEEAKKADIIHVHMRQNHRFVRRALFLSGVSKKLILHDHYGKIATKKRVRPLFRTFYRPDFYIGCSKLLVELAIHKVRLNKDKVFFIKNFVPKHKSEKNEDLKKDIVLVGNLKKAKNHIFAVKLAKELNKTLTIYCSKTNNDYFKNLSKEIDELQMSSNVEFIYNETNIQNELNKYEFALLTSTSEGDPLALIEYMAQGIPFLTYNVGESVNVIKTKLPFFVQNTFNLDEWVQNAKKLSGVNRNTIIDIYDEHYSEDIFLKKYLNVYEKVLN